MIVWLARAWEGIDIYHLVKAAFFADKMHITEYGRPIYGDNYDAAPYGPLAQVIYRLLRRDPIEILAVGGNGELPFRVDSSFAVHATREPNLRKLSASDIEALRVGLEHVRGKSFDDIFNETHDDPAYLRAEGSRMDYRDFIPDDDPMAEEKRQDIFETAAFLVI